MFHHIKQIECRRLKLHLHVQREGDFQTVGMDCKVLAGGRAVSRVFSISERRSSWKGDNIWSHWTLMSGVGSDVVSQVWNVHVCHLLQHKPPYPLSFVPDVQRSQAQSLQQSLNVYQFFFFFFLLKHIWVDLIFTFQEQQKCTWLSAWDGTTCICSDFGPIPLLFEM